MAEARKIRPETALDALGNPTRRAIVRMLAPGPRSVGDIAAALPISRPAVSKHLQLLQRARLVTYDKQGNRNVFRLDQRGFESVRTWLETFWDDALVRFVLAAENSEGQR